MKWEGFLDELEWQFVAEREQEQHMLAVEEERLRIAKLDLFERLRALTEARATVAIMTGALRHTGGLTRMGPDWVGLENDESVQATVTIIPLAAISEIRTRDTGLGVVADETRRPSRVMNFGYLCRDLARRRVPVQLATSNADWLHAVLLRAGVDHLDARAVDAEDRTETRIVAFSSIAALRFTAR